MRSPGRRLGRTTITRAAGDNICQMAEKAPAKPVPDGSRGQFGPGMHAKFREYVQQMSLHGPG
jgi:hypothetical protein